MINFFFHFLIVLLISTNNRFFFGLLSIFNNTRVWCIMVSASLTNNLQLQRFWIQYEQFKVSMCTISNVDTFTKLIRNLPFYIGYYNHFLEFLNRSKVALYDIENYVGQWQCKDASVISLKYYFVIFYMQAYFGNRQLGPRPLMCFTEFKYINGKFENID